MDTLIEKINEMIKGLLVSGIMDILTNTFNTLNSRMGATVLVLSASDITNVFRRRILFMAWSFGMPES